MIDKRIFTKHAAERWFERYPKLSFADACSHVVRGKTINKNLKRQEKRTKCKTYKSWLGPVFIVRGNYVVTVY